MEKLNVVVYKNGTKKYYKDDKLHREDGPAVEYPDGKKVYYKDDRFHREDGPAVEHVNGYKRVVD